MQREVVEQLLLDPNAKQTIICDNLRKIYPGRDGNPDKLAVRGLSLVLQKGQCFGMLGPNGAGKTSFISMVGYKKCQMADVSFFHLFCISVFYCISPLFVWFFYCPSFSPLFLSLFFGSCGFYL
jgi:ABC-type protease/lipase transport system fused ATPase/permease subunit